MGEVRSARVNIVLMECRKHVWQMIHGENWHCSMSQIIISSRFSYRYRIIDFYGALKCLAYYMSLYLGINNISIFRMHLMTDIDILH